MKKERIHSKKEILQLRKELRKNLTPSEAYLWKHLKAKQLDGKKFGNSTVSGSTSWISIAPQKS